MGYRVLEQRTAEPQNIKCRMSKDGIASLFLFFVKIDRIPYFEIRYSLFDIRFFSEFLFRLNWPLFMPAAALNPAPYTIYLLPYTHSLRRKPCAVRRFIEPLNLRTLNLEP